MNRNKICGDKRWRKPSNSSNKSFDPDILYLDDLTICQEVGFASIFENHQLLDCHRAQNPAPHSTFDEPSSHGSCQVVLGTFRPAVVWEWSFFCHTSIFAKCIFHLRIHLRLRADRSSPTFCSPSINPNLFQIISIKIPPC
jgi:hypothetical protein